MKKYMIAAITGMGFGFPITLLCMTLIGGYNNAVIQELTIWMVASACYGLLSVALDSKKLEISLPLSIGLHLLGCIAITFAAAMLCGYITSLTAILIILITAVVVYAAVCGIWFWLMKQNERQINKKLEER